MPSPRLVRLAADPLPWRSDDELMTLAQAGVRDGFEVLVNRHAGRLLNTCSRLVNDADVGAELAQETWVAVWTQRLNYRPEGKFIAWLVSAARNRCRNYLRHHSIARRHLHQDQHASTAPSPDQIDRLLLEERRRRVRDALARLPYRMREAVLLRYAEELRYEEMAGVLRTGESTLRSRVHHGLRLLQSFLEKNR
jgi:RNA polymerase sigma factor (sigma-70 family)